jgi:hypothetical protein
MATTYEPIATTTVTASTAGISFTSIPSTYTDLIIVSTLINSVAGSSVNGIRVRLNNDATALYSNTTLSGNGTTASSTRDTSVTEMYLGLMGQASSTDQPISILNIMNYANSTTFKTIIARGSSAGASVNAGVGLWRSTAAVTRVDLLMPTYTMTGTATLYGIKAA